MITIDDVHMPLAVERGMVGGPEFLTVTHTTPNAVKSTVSLREQALHRWNCSIVGMRDDNIEAMRTFFFERRGPAYGFLFKDWLDYRMTRQKIADGDGAATDFPLFKTYGSFRPYVRYITRPILSGDGALAVWVNNVAQPSGWAFEDGYIKFDVAPTNTHDIEASCYFDVPVQMLSDQLVYQALHTSQAIMPAFEIEEINEFMQLAE